MKANLRTTLLLLAALAAPRVGWAQDIRIPFEGFMTDDQDLPVEGPLDLEIRIYDAEEGGTELFQERHEGVVVSGGYFFLQIGATNALPPNVFEVQDATLLSDNRFIGLTVVGDP
ncbi:MAG: hypothetical protein KC933_24575, partial [Myxococcales bacterium]|nr:hypothetical protein [Myxococcales bacterium]